MDKKSANNHSAPLVPADTAHEKAFFSGVERLVQYTAETIDYQDITDTMRRISGADYAALNVFEDNSRHFNTLALSGIPDHLHKASEILGYKIVGKKWKPDPLRNKKVAGDIITRFASLGELTGEVIPSSLLSLIEKTFHIGECVVVKTTKDKSFIGDFTLIFRKDHHLLNPAHVESFANITGVVFDRIQSSKNLLKTQELLSKSQEIAGLGSWEFDPAADTLTWSDEAYRIFGVSKDKFRESYKAFLDLVHPEDRETVHTAYRQSITNSKNYHEIEFRIIQKDTGEIRHLHEQCEHVRDKSGKIVRSIGTVHDITEVKKSETALRKSENKFRTLVENALDGIYILEEQQFVYANAPLCQLLGCSVDEVLSPGFDFYQHLSESSKNIVRERYQKRLQGFDLSSVYEIEIIAKDGTVKNTEISTAQLSKKPLTVIGILRDITDRKIAEEALQRSLKEKEILLSEIHHRVKNNMTIISSLLTLQTEFSGRNMTQDTLLQELQNRIISMGLVHELVYENQNFVEINSASLLRRLLKHLNNIYQTNDKNITTQIYSDEIMLSMNSSVPFSLLVNEVLTNAWKHAFNGRNTGQIIIAMKREGNGCRLIVEDDGVGVSDLEQLNHPDCFGYTIIHGLVRQLRGEITFSSPQGKGLKIEVSFPGKPEA